MYIYIYIYIHLIMKTMCYHPGYYQNGFDNIYQTLIKINNNTEMFGKICPNLKLTPPCTLLPQNN